MKRCLSCVVALSACIQSTPGTDPTQSASPLALSRDDALLYAVDTDSAQLAVIDTASETQVAVVKVGDGASRVIVAPDDTIYVANRFAHSVSVIARGNWVEARRIEAGVEPVGLALSSDGKTLYVVSAVAKDTARHGTLLAIDPASGTPRWELALGEEPRGIALIDDSRAAVTLLKQGDVMFVDLGAQRIAKAGTTIYADLNRTSLSNDQPQGVVDTSHPRGVDAVVVTPDRKSLFALGTLSREGVANQWGGCAATLVSAPAMMQLAPDGTANVDDLLGCVPRGVPTVISAPGNREFFDPNPTVIQGPSAIAFDRTSTYAYVAAQQSNSVVIVRNNGGTKTVVSVGAGPSGIAVRHDGLRAYVLNAFDHTVSVLRGADDGSVKRASDIRIADETLAPDAAAGRKIFFDATDARMAAATKGAACATCHIDNGREDGHVWSFDEGKRQTMSLAGGRLDGTAPFHWDGALADLPKLMDSTTTGRMGGTGPTLEMEQAVQAYLATLPAPLNPKQLGPPTDAQARGADVFKRAACGSCHLGQKLTNNAMVDVGTGQTMNVPSLLGVARSAPYLHDGRAKTLEDRLRLRQGENLHGTTSALSDQDISDLVEYLETL
jgi:DNA-binding beta-propeller fold protein YncE/cytochrome c1